MDHFKYAFALLFLLCQIKIDEQKVLPTTSFLLRFYCCLLGNPQTEVIWLLPSLAEAPASVSLSVSSPKSPLRVAWFLCDHPPHFFHPHHTTASLTALSNASHSRAGWPLSIGAHGLSAGLLLP